MQLKEFLNEIDKAIFKALEEAIKATERNGYEDVVFTHELQRLLKFRRDFIQVFKRLRKLKDGKKETMATKRT